MLTLFRSIVVDDSMRRYSFVLFFLLFILCYQFFPVWQMPLERRKGTFLYFRGGRFWPKCFPENSLPKAKTCNQNRCFTYVL